MKRLWMLCTALAVGACTQDSPTEVGTGLLPSETVRTFEITLGPEQWIQWDSAFGLYSEPADADFAILANSFEGALNSRILLRYQLPTVISVVDTLGVTRADSMPQYFSGTVRFTIDTIASAPPADIQLFRTTEGWDRVSANWQFRVDTPGVQVPWSQPGGSPGALISSDTWAALTDTVQLAVDSATLAVWADTTDAARGAVVHVATPNTRLRTSLPVLRVRARSSFNPDTVFELSVAPGRTFIFEPAQPLVTIDPRVGGTPAWRTIARLRDRMDTVTVACPGVPNCRLRLGEVTVNRAAVLLQPVPAPSGFGPELPLVLSLHALLPSPLLPLQRSPITGAWGTVAAAIPVESFRDPGAPVVQLPITEFTRIMFSSPEETGQFRPTHITLLASGTQRTFGFGTFAALPSLRIVVTTAMELELP